ncbi:UDP-N-acetylenolpyruvoylglucosamine reductase [Minicystis rosea]|nr:UDP-N-acetylenolpyruvoylglucosamine reductase [Minicystis rosea]
MMSIREGILLAPRTTLGVGGPARHFVEATTEAEVIEALAFARARGLETLVLGGGSNLLVADRGFDGLVLCPRVRGLDIEDRHDVVEIDAGAGEPWDEFVAHAVSRGWAGIECLSGIPGDVGATPIQNVGAYGQDVSETIVRVRVIERSTGASVELDRSRCGFGYRDSIFKREDANRFVITRVRFALRPGGAPSVKYAELEKKLAGRPSPTLAEVRETVIALRRSKSMVLDPSDENGKSAGSFFTNPTLDIDSAGEVERRVVAAGVLAPGEAMPKYAAEGGQVKLSAAWLIERAGFKKGTHEGPVGISTKHSLALVNRGGARASDIVSFARRVRDGVREKFGVTLVPEPVMVGFTREELGGLSGEG